MRPYVVVDIETTGTQPLNSDIIEIGAVYIENNQVIRTFNKLVKPEQEISSSFQQSMSKIQKKLLGHLIKNAMDLF